MKYSEIRFCTERQSQVRCSWIQNEGSKKIFSDVDGGGKVQS